ncbi:MAG: hypothetical protein HYX84_06235 [Chloroflexi bacterium]|nr:hypothetical protein [Chloroflexota bacterium]
MTWYMWDSREMRLLTPTIRWNFSHGEERVRSLDRRTNGAASNLPEQAHILLSTALVVIFEMAKLLS